MQPLTNTTGFLYSPFEKNTLTVQQKDIVEMAYSIKKIKIITGLDLLITAPLSVFTANKMVMMRTVIKRNTVYLINQAIQCNQLLNPIIFIDSYNDSMKEDNFKVLKKWITNSSQKTYAAGI